MDFHTTLGILYLVTALVLCISVGSSPIQTCSSNPLTQVSHFWDEIFNPTCPINSNNINLITTKFTPPAPHPSLFILGDLHGDFESTVALLRASKLLSLTPSNDWVGGKSILVQLGDIVDRGPDGSLIYKLFRKLGLQAKQAGGKIIHLFGNHEGFNLCNIFKYVNPYEVKTYFNNDVAKMASEWSVRGELGQWMRREFEVVANYHHFVFVHAGLLPQYAHLSPSRLKELFLQRIDEGKCEFLGDVDDDDDYEDDTINYINDRSGSRELKIPHDILWSDNSPLWARKLSWESESHICPIVETSLENMSQTIQHEIEMGRISKATYRGSGDAIGTSSGGEIYKHSTQAKSQLDDYIYPLKVMIVGHSPTQDGNVNLRCKKIVKPKPHAIRSRVGMSQNESPSYENKSKESSNYYYQYIMADTGVSRYTHDKPRIIQINIKYRRNKECQVNNKNNFEDECEGRGLMIDEINSRNSTNTPNNLSQEEPESPYIYDWYEISLTRYPKGKQIPKSHSINNIFYSRSTDKTAVEDVYYLKSVRSLMVME